MPQSRSAVQGPQPAFGKRQPPRRGRGSRLDTLIQAVRYALRQVRRAPGFTAAAALSLALGVGATTATYGVVDAVLLRPLAYRDADDLVLVMHRRTLHPSILYPCIPSIPHPPSAGPQ